ncbi:uncharacterized protein MEPE_01552 [Melanopsichium pennsylvanicum]|uniref:NAD(P)-binding protein n=2 Tax=Melanopsichium pennsylvanicum TaxID=63383 RepID=A0AAJ5C3P4_9BASI|nr:conserved hypothetical protein [Melanopsichium pennsylvanicum 4]SNX82846.1 uncharacterized protein MEPE_01552 [Melanopsichium pennsylvanicum]
MTDSVPSVYDTRCKGPGLLPTTVPWSSRYCTLRKYGSDSSTSLTFPDPNLVPDYSCVGKTVIVSGSNSGIGKQAAIYFASAGATVVMACRLNASHEQHPEEARKDVIEQSGCKGSQVELWEIDCSSLANIEAFGKRWQESGRTCDILVNNAGLSAGTRRITEEGFELTHVINFLSHTLLTFYLLPSMRNAIAPRIINTCSIFHNGGTLDFSNMDNELKTPLGIGCVQAYCDTKLWFLMWSVELQERLSRSEDYKHVIVHGIHPGFVGAGSMIWHSPDHKVFAPLKFILNTIINRYSIDSKQGSYAIIYAALDPALGLPCQYLQNQAKQKKLQLGESAKWGGKFINRNKVDIRRPEVDDILARSRLWQRVLQDVQASKRNVATDLPDHLESVKSLGRPIKA